MYADGQEVVNLPGSNEPFSLLKYKEALGKTFAKLILYLGYSEASEMHSNDVGDGGDNDAISSPFDFNNDRNDFLATTDCVDPALNSFFTNYTNDNDVDGLLPNKNKIISGSQCR